MAITHFITDNLLLKRAKHPNQRNQGVILLIGALLSLIGLIFINTNYALFVLLLAGIISLFVPSDPIDREKYLAGATGENYALSLIKTLSDKFTIFNQIYLPNPHSSTGANEADLIICGTNAIFVIEVKHNTGNIICDEQAAQWNILKTGRKGTVYTTHMRNPIAQVKLLSYLLSTHFKTQQIKVWVQGIVLFTHPNAVLNHLTTPSLPVMLPDQLITYIESFQTKIKANTTHLNRAVAVINRLRI